MQQLVILLLINCSSILFGRLYAHRQEVRLRFHCIWLSVLLWLLWCWRVGWQTVCTVWSRLLDCWQSLPLPLPTTHCTNDQIFVGFQYGTCFESSFWRLDFEVGSLAFGIFVGPWSKKMPPKIMKLPPSPEKLCRMFWSLEFVRLKAIGWLLVTWNWVMG